MLFSKKIIEERIKLIDSNIESDEKFESLYISRILNKGDSASFSLLFLASYYEFLASKNYLSEKDIEKFKQQMYVYIKLEILQRSSVGIFKYRNYDFWGILMSNNREILNFMINNIDYVAYEDRKEGPVRKNADGYLARTTLLALKGDWDEVIKRSDNYLAKPMKSSYYKYMYLEFEFLKALALKDREKMIEILEMMLEKKVAKKMLYEWNTAFDFYLQMYVLIYAKIAMLHGIDLGIDHELAPKELIDITPAKEYIDPYDFMKEVDFKTFTIEKWEEWIDKYRLDPEKNYNTY